VPRRPQGRHRRARAGPGLPTVVGMIEEREDGVPSASARSVSPSAAALLARLREAAADRAPAGAQGLGSRLAARRRAPIEGWDDASPDDALPEGRLRDDALPDDALPDGGPDHGGGAGAQAPARRLGIPRRAAWAALAVAGVVCALLVARGAAEGGPVETVLPSRRPAVAPPSRAGVQADDAARGGAGPGAASPPSRSGTGSGPSPSALVVDVVGRVRRPGLVRLAPGSRVWDAVLAAGGAVPGSRLDRVNLARPVVDGEQVRVPGADDPVPPEPPPAAGPGAAATAGSTGGAAVIDLNAATAEQLDALPGVGPVLAARILQWRAGHGRFSRVEELGEVDGIGPKLFSHLRPRVRV